MNKGNQQKELLEETQDYLEQRKVDDELYEHVVAIGFDQLLANPTRENALIAYRRDCME